jgi:hypothetical protein
VDSPAGSVRQDRTRAGAPGLSLSLVAQPTAPKPSPSASPSAYKQGTPAVTPIIGTSTIAVCESNRPEKQGPDHSYRVNTIVRPTLGPEQLAAKIVVSPKRLRQVAERPVETARPSS